MTKKKIIAYEDLQKLKKTFEKEKSNRGKLALSLLDEAFFCGETLKKLKEKVNDDGVITIMTQGDYEIERENPALKSYNTTIKNYYTLIKQITDLLPIDKKGNVEDDFDTFNDDEC
jgi:hypothetical protein